MPMNRACLSIAGSDPSGGAGIQADLKTFHRHGVYGAAAITLVTVQNTRGVARVELLDPELVAAQVRAVLDDLPVRVVKTGALGSAAIASAVASELRGRLLPLVLDPVMISKHGAPLLAEGEIPEIVSALFPMASLVTPNLPEAEALLGRAIHGLEEQRCAARDLCDRTGCGAALVKGGHGDGADVVDVLWDGRAFREWRAPRIDTLHTHGTGCTTSAAIAAFLARDLSLPDAVGAAVDWVRLAIATAPGIGGGQGPVNHFA